MAIYSTLPYDILYQLCIAVQAVGNKSLKILSFIDKRTRSAAIPVLFRSIAYKPGKRQKNIPWKRLIHSSSTFMDNSELQCLVKRIKFLVCIENPEKHPIPPQFFDLLRTFKNLTGLELLLQREYFEQIRSELFPLDAVETEQSNENMTRNYLVFSSVQSLTIASPAWLDLSPLFPNIHSLEIDGWDQPQVGVDYEYISRMHPHLRKLYSPDQGVSKVLQEIVRHLPNIEELGLFGRIEIQNGGWIVDDLPSYAPLRKLRSLSIPSITELGLYFRTGYRCSDPGPREMKRRLESQKLMALAQLCEGVEATLTGMQDGHKEGLLKELRIGNPRRNNAMVYLVSADGKLEKVDD